MPNLERRSVAELRTAGRRLEGLAVPYNVEAKIGDFTEIMAPGAMRWGPDVLALVDHDPTKLLGRSRAGSLRLQQAPDGVHFSLDMPSTTLAEDTLELARRGLLGGVSVGFIAEADHWDGRRREVRAAILAEVSIVSSWPAYSTTSVAVRSCPPPRPRLIAARRWVQTV